MSAPYNLKELMAIVAAQEIQDGDIVFTGTGISMLAAMAAKHINAPSSIIFFETGALDSQLEEMPLAVGDPRVMMGAAGHVSLAEVFAFTQNRYTSRRIIGILGAAQIDPYGNLNSTVIGDYHSPKVRFSGSGGACDVGSFVQRVMVFMQQDKRKFVPKLDYLTCPGWLDGPGARERAGLGGGGPSVVITDMGVFRYDEATKRMYLAGYYPGVTPQKILENMGFEVDVSRAEEVVPPTGEQLRILREKCDPQKLIL